MSHLLERLSRLSRDAVGRRLILAELVEERVGMRQLKQQALARQLAERVRRRQVAPAKGTGRR